MYRKCKPNVSWYTRNGLQSMKGDFIDSSESAQVSDLSTLLLDLIS